MYGTVTARTLIFSVYVMGALYFMYKSYKRLNVGPQWRKINNKNILLSSAESTMADGVIDVNKIDTTFNSVGGL